MLIFHSYVSLPEGIPNRFPYGALKKMQDKTSHMMHPRDRSCANQDEMKVNMSICPRRWRSLVPDKS